MQWSVRINEAYKRLKDPLRRAAYLCELNGVPLNAEDNTSMPADFLMQQMEWREALEDASTEAELITLDAQVRAVRQQTLGLCAHSIDVQPDYRQAAQQVRALMFVDRFERDIEARLDQMESAHRGQ